jgi:hypothetical protein
VNGIKKRTFKKMINNKLNFRAMKRFFLLTAIIAVAILFSACKKVPQAEMDAATLALQQAKTAQADVYMVADYVALQDSLNAITVSIESKKGKVFGNFKEPKQKLNDVSMKAAELVTKTEARKSEIKNEVTASQDSVAEIMAENSKLVAMAPKGKEGKQAIESIMSDLSMINSSVNEVPAMVQKDDLLAAQTKINAAQQKAKEINTELKIAIEKYAKKN